MDWRQRLARAVQLHQTGQLVQAIDLYREVLRERQDNSDALHLLGMALEQAGHPAQGKPFVELAIRQAPRVAAYHNSLGNIYRALNEPDAAREEYLAALDCDPAFAEALNNLGLVEQAAQDWPAAIGRFNAALQIDPDFMSARFNKAATEWMAGQQDSAIGPLAELLQTFPDYAKQVAGLAKRCLALKDTVGAERLRPLLLPHAAVAADNHFIDGVLASMRDDSAAAEANFRAALALDPQHPEAPAALANLLVGKEAFQEAVPVLEQVLRRSPENLAALTSLGMALTRLERYEQAIPILHKVLASQPECLAALADLVKSLDKVNRYTEAREVCLRLITMQPDGSAGYANLAGIEMRLGNLDAARRAAEEAYRIDPEAPLSIGALANVRLMDRKFDEAEELFRKHAALAPDDETAQNNLGLLLLRLERYAEAWPHFSLRWRSKTENARGSGGGSVPPWDGKLPPSGRLVLWREQGVGDQIMYAGMIPEIVASGADLLLAVDPRMVALYARSFPNTRVVADDKNLDVRALGVDCQCSIAEVARFLRPDIASFARHPAAYLKADPDAEAKFRARYRQPGHHLIGISWVSRNPRKGQGKSLPLIEMAPFLQEPNTSFVSLQYGPSAADVETLKEETGLVVRHDPEVDPLADIDAQAAQIAALDMVVTVSTTAAHIAAALGKPTLILLPDEWSQLWYWGTSGDRARWYPSVRLCRAVNGNKAEMMDRALAMFREMRADLSVPV